MVRKIWVASTCPKELFRSAVIVPDVLLASQADRRLEGGLRGAAVLDDRAHGKEDLGGVDLPEGTLQLGGDGGRRRRGQPPRGGVLLLLPVEQERLRGGLRGQLRTETGSQPDDQHADRDDDDRGQLRPLRPPARGRGLLPGLRRRPGRYVTGRPRRGGGQAGGPGHL